MSDDLVGALLRDEADRLSTGVTPPPLDLLSPRRRSLLAPIAAAAAVVLVAGAAFAAIGTLRDDGGPVPITSFGAVVPYDKDEPTTKFGDAPAPEQERPKGFGAPLHEGPPPYANDGTPLCDTRQVDAALELAKGEDAGRLRLIWTGPRDEVCRLRDDTPVVTLLGADGSENARSTYTVQPAVRNPPAVTARYLGSRSAIETAFTWTSSCGAAAVQAQVTGLTSEPISASLGGTPPMCTGGKASTPRLGRFGGDGVVPAGRQGLQVRLDAPADGTPGELVTLVAEVANPTHEPLSLSPCPTWLFEYDERYGLEPGETGKAGTSGAQSTRMPCDRLPSSVAPGSAVRFEIRERLGDATPDLRGIHPLAVRFGIAGAKRWNGTVQLDHGTPPAPVATVPWKDTPKPPGAAATGAPAIGTKMPLASLYPTIEGLPASVHRGETLHYWIRVTNMATGGDGVSLDPCPGFVQSLDLDSGKRQIADEHYVNCDAAPASIAPGTAIRLDMELNIPTDAPTGPAGLAWKLGKLDFTGSESAMTSIAIE
jgi:hypothetical protein